MRIRIRESAPSFYAGKVGKCIVMSSGRGKTWTRGTRFAKFFGIVFNEGACAGRTCWFTRGEVQLENEKEDG